MSGGCDAPPDLKVQLVGSRTTWVVVCANMQMLAHGACQASILPLLPLIRTRYDLSVSELAWIVALPQLSALLMSVFLGRLGDRIGNGRLMVLAGLCLVLSSVAHTLPTLAALLVARLAFGIGTAALWNSTMAWMFSVDARRAPNRVAGALMATATGASVGPIAAALLTAALGFNAPFLAGAVLLALCGGALVCALAASRSADASSSEGPVRARRDTGRRTHAGGAGRARRRQVPFAVLRDPGARAGAITLSLSGATAVVLQFLVPIQMNSWGHSPGETGLILAAGAITFIAASLVASRIGHRMTTFTVNAWLAVAVAVVIVPAAIGASAMWLLISVLAFSVPRASIAPVAFTLATSSPELKKELGPGAVIGSLNSLFAVFAIVAPLLAGIVVDVADARWVYVAVIIISIGSFGALVRRPPREAGFERRENEVQPSDDGEPVSSGASRVRR